MAYLFDTGIFAANDSSGASLSGAKLTFYDNGTTTLKNTYPTKADAEAGTNANANPVVADANGRWGAIWLDDTFYTVKFQPADGSFTRTRDDIGGALADLASTASGKGAGLVGFSHSATYADGTVGASIQDRGIFVMDEPYNAKFDGSTDDRAAIQSAIDAASAMATSGSIVPVLMPGGKTAIIGSSGSTIASRQYGLLLKSGVSLEAIGGMATLKQKNSTDIDLINTDRGSSKSNIGLKNIILDGNEANQGSSPTAGFTLWAYDINGLFLENVKTADPASWGFRIQLCDNVHINGITCDHNPESNADGIHFIDTNNVTGSDIDIYTEGDDAFIISAETQNVTGYNITGLRVEAKYTSLVAGLRGVVLLGDDAVMTGARTISDVYISSVAENCRGGAVVLTGASYEDVHIESTSNACGADLYLVPGTATYAGFMRNCSFDIVGSDSVIGNAGTGGSVYALVNYGTFTGNKINALLRNPADNTIGVALYGDEWRGSISLDYDPNASKSLPQQGVVIWGDRNVLEISAKGATKNLLLQGSSQDGVYKIGRLSGGTTNDLEISAGSTGNNFFGGTIAGTITNSGGTTNRFYGVRGATAQGVSTVANLPTGSSGDRFMVSDANATTFNSIVAGGGANFVPVHHDGTNWRIG